MFPFFVAVQTESRGLFGRRTTYDNPWAPGVTEKSFGDLAKVLRSGEMGALPTEQETREDLPPAEVRWVHGSGRAASAA